MKVQAKIIIGVLLIIIGGIFGWNLKKSEYITNTVTVVDTLYVKTPPVIKWKTAYVNISDSDTIVVTKRDTIYIQKNLRIASDTTYFEKDTLHTWYFFPPVNRFKYEFYRAPVTTIYETKTITMVKKPKWYKNPYLWGGVGLITGIMLGGK